MSSGLPWARHILILAHAGSLPRIFGFPRSEPLRGLAWRPVIDTGRPPPHDIVTDGSGPLIDVSRPLERPARSLLVLVADPAAGPMTGGTQTVTPA